MMRAETPPEEPQRQPAPARLEAIGHHLGRLLSGVRMQLALIARSRSVRVALASRMAAGLLCIGLASWTHRELSEAAALQNTWGPQVQVLVLRHDIGPGEEVEESDTVAEMRPRSLTPPGAVSELQPGTTANAVLLAGEPLLIDRLSSSEDRVAPPGTTAIRLDLAVRAPDLHTRDVVDVLGRGVAQLTGGVEPVRSEGDRSAPGVVVVSRGAVVLRPPSDDDPTVEVAVDEDDLGAVADAAFTGGVAVVRRSR